MSRLIDRLPTPEVLPHVNGPTDSACHLRVGNFSLYQALKMLGYQPYHMYEVVCGGTTHLSLFEEALRFKFLGGGKPYGKAEFDKWLANYDTVVEVPQFFLDEFVEYYPDAKFILTERNIDKWLTSMDNSAVPLFEACRKFPLSMVRKMDDYLDAFCKLHCTFEDIVYHGHGARSESGRESAARDTLEGNAKAKTIAPPDRFVACKLEDGFGWEQICPLLGHDIPEQPYPRGNAPAEFEAMANETLVPRLRRVGLIILTAVAVPVASVAALYLHNSGRLPQADRFARKCFEPLELYSLKDNFRSLADQQQHVRYLKEDTIARFLELPDILAVSPVLFHMLSYIGAFPFLRDAPVILGLEQLIMVVSIMTERYNKILAKGVASRRKLLFKSLAVYDRKLSEIGKQQRGSSGSATSSRTSHSGDARSHAPGFAVDKAGEDTDDEAADDDDDDDELVLAALSSLDINDAFKAGDAHAATTHGAMIPADNFRRLIMLLLLVAPIGPQENLSSYAERVSGSGLEGLRTTAENVLSAFINVERSPGITFAQFDNTIPVNFPHLFRGFNSLFEHFLFSKTLDLSKRKGSVSLPAPPPLMPPLIQRDTPGILDLNVLSQLSFFIDGNQLFRRMRLLYSGAEAGFSMGSFETKVFNWRAPTILLVSGTRLSDPPSNTGSEGNFNDSLPPKRFPNGSSADHDRLVFGALVQEPWRVTHKECFGGADSILFQLGPIHDVFPASAVNRDYVAFTKSPAAHPGISFGCPPPPARHHHHASPAAELRHLGPVSLVIDSSFEFGVFHHDHTARGGAFATSSSGRHRRDLEDRFAVDDIEVWGCGGDAEARAQAERWAFEAREAEARRRVNLGTGDAAADRALLEMAGLVGANRSGGSMA
ncbi:TLD-domain-containing protein [Xylariaceae sp. FL0804]|nr:TLD-domain-containing protein [Xylariaceae sp. FL0804]